MNRGRGRGVGDGGERWVARGSPVRRGGRSSLRRDHDQYYRYSYHENPSGGRGRSYQRNVEDLDPKSMSDRHMNFGYEGGRGNSYRQRFTDAPDQYYRYSYHENPSGGRGRSYQRNVEDLDPKSMSDRHMNFGYEGGRGNSYRQRFTDALDENNRYFYNENTSGNRGRNGQKKEYFDRNKNYGGEGSRGNSGKQVRVYVPVGIKEGQFNQGEGAPDGACGGSSSLDVSSAGLVNDIGICVPLLSDQSRPGIHDIDVGKIQISENPIKGVENGADSIKESQRRVNVPLGEFFQPSKPGIDAKPYGNKKHVSEMSSVGNVSGIRCSESSEARQGYDICFLKTGAPFTLKPSLLEVNKEKRKEMKKAVEGKIGEILGPGLILLKNHLSIHEQAQIVNICRTLGHGPGGFYQPGYKDGAKLHLKMMCLGKNWDPETSQYVDVRPVDGAKPPPLPSEFNQWVHRSIQESHKLIKEAAKNAKAENTLPSMSPDLCIVNFYTSTGKLGLHQDRDESAESLRKGLPVVSFSIGDSAEFLYSDQRDVDKAEKVLLESGDILIFGGKSRHIFHGVERILPNTAPKSLLEETNLLRPGRLNLTFRKY